MYHMLIRYDNQCVTKSSRAKPFQKFDAAICYHFELIELLVSLKIIFQFV